VYCWFSYLLKKLTPTALVKTHDEEKTPEESASKEKSAEEKAALLIQKTWRRHLFKTQLSFNWHDLQYMYSASLALRENAYAPGMLEKEQGNLHPGGDGYSLANLAFDPAKPILDKNNPDELLFRKQINEISYFKGASLFPDDYSGYHWRTMRQNGAELLLGINPWHSVPQQTLVNIQIGLTRKMNVHIKAILQMAYDSFHKEESTVFHILRLRGAQDSYDHKDIYPTGKCGKQSFSSEQILATIQEGVYFKRNAQKGKGGVKVPFDGVRFAYDSLEKPTGGSLGFMDLIKAKVDTRACK